MSIKGIIKENVVWDRVRICVWHRTEDRILEHSVEDLVCSFVLARIGRPATTQARLAVYLRDPIQ